MSNRNKYSFLKNIVLIILISITIRVFFFEIYLIPSNSMNNTLLTGDIILVSKFHYGARLDGKKQNPGRVPGITKIKRNDILVFNFPEADTVYSRRPEINYHEYLGRKGRDNAQADTSQFGKLTEQAITFRQPFIKRCIALPGEKLQLINHYAYINDSLILSPQGAIIHRTPDPNAKPPPAFLPALNRIGALYETGEHLKKNYKDGYRWEFPHCHSFNWVGHFYGPLIVPKKGDTLTITAHNYYLYKRIIDTYEANAIKVKDSVVYINGKPNQKYVVQKNYYFVLGDNRKASIDSRFWGYLPEDHIIGKAICVVFSFDKDEAGLSKIRWNRFFKPLK